MRMFLYGFMAIALWISASAEADVYRCENPELGIVYQQTPCPEAEEEPAAEPTTKECQFCCTEIAIKATRCPNCTSELAG